jgi:hypothetical protein
MLCLELLQVQANSTSVRTGGCTVHLQLRHAHISIRPEHRLFLNMPISVCVHGAPLALVPEGTRNQKGDEVK